MATSSRRRFQTHRFDDLPLNRSPLEATQCLGAGDKAHGSPRGHRDEAGPGGVRRAVADAGEGRSGLGQPTGVDELVSAQEQRAQQRQGGC